MMQMNQQMVFESERKIEVLTEQVRGLKEREAYIQEQLVGISRRWRSRGAPASSRSSGSEWPRSTATRTNTRMSWARGEISELEKKSKGAISSRPEAKAPGQPRLHHPARAAGQHPDRDRFAAATEKLELKKPPANTGAGSPLPRPRARVQ